MSLKNSLSLVCLTGTLSLFADAANGEIAQVEQKPTPKAQEKATSPSKDIEVMMEKNTKVVLQIEPGSRLIIRNTEENQAKPQNPRLAQTPASSTTRPAPAKSKAAPAAAKTNRGEAKNVTQKQKLATTMPDASQPNENTDENTAMQPMQQHLFNWRPPLNRHDVYLFGEWLLWKVNLSKVDYVLSGFPPEFFNSSTEHEAFGTLHSAHYNWHSGFRVGGGVVFMDDFWDLEGIYTQFNDAGNDHVIGTPDNLIVGSLPLQIVIMGEAKSHISFRYKLGDLLLGKRVQISKRILMRPVLGLTGGEIAQHWHISYLPNLQVSHSVSRSKTSWRFHGMGLRAGVESDWELGMGLGVFGQLTAAFMYGAYKNNIESHAYDLQTGAITPITNTKFEDHRIVPHVQIALGPNWGMNFKKWSINIFAGYEINALFNVHELQLSGFSDAEGARASQHFDSIVTMQGGTGKLQFNIAF